MSSDKVPDFTWEEWNLSGRTYHAAVLHPGSDEAIAVVREGRSFAKWGVSPPWFPIEDDGPNEYVSVAAAGGIEAAVVEAKRLATAELARLYAERTATADPDVMANGGPGRNGICQTCGEWTPEDHPEAHPHADDCAWLAAELDRIAGIEKPRDTIERLRERLAQLGDRMGVEDLDPEGRWKWDFCSWRCITGADVQPAIPAEHFPAVLVHAGGRKMTRPDTTRDAIRAANAEAA